MRVSLFQWHNGSHLHFPRDAGANEEVANDLGASPRSASARTCCVRRDGNPAENVRFIDDRRLEVEVAGPLPGVHFCGRAANIWVTRQTGPRAARSCRLDCAGDRSKPVDPTTAHEGLEARGWPIAPIEIGARQALELEGGFHRRAQFDRLNAATCSKSKYGEGCPRASR